MKKGLILEGGAMRGLFTAGVLDVFLREGFKFDAIVGVSAGAAFGCNFKSQQAGRVLRYNKKYCKDKRYCSFRSLLKTGDLFGAEFCYKTLPEELDKFDNDTFISDKAEFYVVCTDIETGKPIYRKCETGLGEDLQWFRASASMPLAAKIVEIGDKKLLDGGISDSIPLKFFVDKGFSKNVVILTQPDGYVKKANPIMPVIRSVYRKYPALVKNMSERHLVYNETLSYVKGEEKNGNALVIRPHSPLPVGHTEHNPHKLQTAYDMGVCAAEDRLDEIRKFIATSYD